MKLTGDENSVVACVYLHYTRESLQEGFDKREITIDPAADLEKAAAQLAVREIMDGFDEGTVTASEVRAGTVLAGVRFD
jgi:hypothetical protein